ncbi:disease resistance protein RPP13-like isoform X3 [Salvia hispanica]|uniref:disease resistance protein RPP13-like isoform X3 n=1 Tax=Salvia hispanica TaxID=49212 RepID=UPI0020098C58|nr:disease resistance protein RPP13-like isoform X3 [Salvia hispanica]
MAATAYASLVSLLNTMDQIQAHPRLSPNFYSCQLQSLGEIVDFLVDFVVNYSEKAEIAMGRIGDIAHEAEHMIEVAAADLIRDRSTLKSVEKMLEQMIQEMSSIKEEMIKFKEESVLPSSSSSDAPAITMPTPPLPRSSSSSSLRAAKNTMLGFNHHVDRLLEELIGHESRSRRIIPIVGMGGAGKTTLAKHVYGHPSVVELFDFRAWITVSQEHNAIHILSQALSCLGVAVSKDKADHELGHKLYQTLFRQKYLIVLDDLWSHVAWERVQHFFPNDDTGSRIVVTTRQQQVSKSLGKSLGFSSLDVGFLDFDISWDLFHEVTFAGQHCPPQLEGTAKKIVGKCRGLPLAICVIGGLLRKSTGTQEYWEEIAKDKSLVLEYSESELGALKSTWKTIGRRFVMSPHLQMHKMERGLKNLLRRRQCGSFYSNGSSIVLCYVMLCVARY